MSAISYVASLWERCVAAARSAADSKSGAGPQSRSDGQFATGSRDGDYDAGDPTLLLYGQLLWMVVALALLYALALLSAQLYFLVSFIGLLCNRVLFAPRAVAARWWWVVNTITWLCFAVLSYIVYLRITASATGSA